MLPSHIWVFFAYKYTREKLTPIFFVFSIQFNHNEKQRLHNALSWGNTKLRKIFLALPQLCLRMSGETGGTKSGEVGDTRISSNSVVMFSSHLFSFPYCQGKTLPGDFFQSIIYLFYAARQLSDSII